MFFFCSSLGLLYIIIFDWWWFVLKWYGNIMFVFYFIDMFRFVIVDKLKVIFKLFIY